MKKKICLMCVAIAAICLTEYQKSNAGNALPKEKLSAERDIPNVTAEHLDVADVSSSCPDGNHPHKIDLGLPSRTKWACCNVGATRPENSGKYYAWGEINSKTVFSPVSYKYATGDDVRSDGWTYERNIVFQNLGRSICNTRYDVATMVWGDPWRMPSDDQFAELIDNCTYISTTVNNVRGMMFTSKVNRRRIFFPASGYRNNTGTYSKDETGYYWSGTQSTKYESDALTIALYCRGYSKVNRFGTNRISGHTIRPVSN